VENESSYECVWYYGYCPCSVWRSGTDWLWNNANSKPSATNNSTDMINSYLQVCSFMQRWTRSYSCGMLQLSVFTFWCDQAEVTSSSKLLDDVMIQGLRFLTLMYSTVQVFLYKILDVYEMGSVSIFQWRGYE
jgi:hypothetical protein